MNNIDFLTNVINIPTEEHDVKISFINYIGRYAAYYQNRMSELCLRYGINNADDIVNESTSLYYTMVHTVSLRTLIYELHLSKEEASGLSPEEHYEQFCSQFDDRAYFLGFSEKYPVLTEKIRTLTLNTLTLCEDVFSALERDRELLLDGYGFDTKKLEHMSFSGDTDSHNHGKKAIMLEAGGVKIIYKPHSLANDIFFSKLFEELSPKLTYDLRTMRSDDMGDYGWQEFACAVKPGTEDEKKKYYCRYGEIMAIAYSLAMGDLHKENIISCGEYPVIIDTETMISNSSYTLSQVKADRYSAAMTRAMKDTVLDTMLLPMNLSHNIFDIDISPLSSGKKQASQKIAGYRLKNEFSDDICLEKEYYTEEAAEEENAYRFMPQILSGFTGMIRYILSDRAGYEKMILSLLRGTDVRIRQVLRPTYVYAKFMDASNHPDYLGSFEKQSALIGKLKSSAYKGCEKFSRLADMETESILGGDIPYFYQPAGSKELCSIFGSIENFFDEDILSIVRKRISCITEDDLVSQQRIIKLAMSTMFDDSWDRSSEVALEGMETYTPHLREGGMEGVYSAADYFCHEGRWDDEHEMCIWLSHIIGDSVRVGPMLSNVYDGGGSVLFLARLAAASGNKGYFEYAEGGISAFELAPANDTLSAFNGIGSMLYIYYSMYRITGLKKYYGDYKRVLEHIRGIVPDEDASIDYCGGLAGMAVLLGRIYRYEKDELLRELAAEYMDICMERSGSIEMNGLAHGYSGLMMAAAICYDMTGDKKYYRFMEKMFEIENRSYDPERNNWKDLRYPDADTEQIYWCHGAAGIALARLEGYLAAGESKYLSDIEKCIDKLESSWRNSGDHSLCHGRYGILDCLSEIGRKLPEYRERTEKLTAEIYSTTGAEIAENGIKCGIANAHDMFSFMLGMTGMAYSIMRYNGIECPSVLTLEV